ncbi:MAG: SCO family protein [Bacteroidetes bacterium]|jgi:protein SCO1/2|nr:SCO family protein [Bacteroidota bacterium]
MIKKTTHSILPILTLSLAFVAGSAYADNRPAGQVRVGIEERLGHMVPLDLVFKDSKGRNVTLRQIADGKPLIIDMAYYECPGICDVVMGGLARVVTEVPQVLGRDFNVATISFNPADKPSDAMKKKQQFWGSLKDRVSSSAWRFLTGDSAGIHELTDSLGFHFVRDKYGMFTHPTALIFLSGDGRIVRYVQGTTFAEADVRMALTEAKANSPAYIITSTPKVCFSHNPEGNKIADIILQLGGAGTLVFVAGFLLFMKSKKKLGRNDGQKEIS